jgi:hypothetical protein
MRLTICALAAVATLAVTVPASAQEFRFRAGEDGVGVRVGRDHDGWRERREYRYGEGREHRWREGRGDCRIVITRFRNDDGDIVVRKVRRCG